MTRGPCPLEDPESDRLSLADFLDAFAEHDACAQEEPERAQDPAARAARRLRECAGEIRRLRSKVRQSEEEICSLDAELSKQETRIADLERLHQASTAELEAATVAKTQFLANMSHEIRTPMNAVIGMTALLSDTSLTSAQHELVATIRASGALLLSIINDILNFSKINAGRLELAAAPFSLGDLVERSFALIAGAVGQKDLSLFRDIVPGTPEIVVGDAVRLQQILVNLLTNAVKFTEHGEIGLRVRSLAPAGEGASVTLKFSVRDTGIGIPADRVGRLFAPFTQVDASTTRQFGGTGLGLAISKQLVELMGGSIWLESEPGRGSTFHFTVQAKVGCAAAAAAATALQAPTMPPSSRPRLGALHPLRILVAEDNRLNQRVLRLLLEGFGYEPDIVEDGARAVEAVLARPYDLVFMDVQMPEMDGLAATRAIRAAFPRGAGPRIVALTAQTLSGDRDKCLAAGMDGYVPKPFGRELLLAELEATLRGRLGAAGG
jgi:signal transduction histidine kinase